ncbi:MAG: hypothetical protein ACXWQO_09045 [Bdellovibrionota bacterium]
MMPFLGIDRGSIYGNWSPMVHMQYFFLGFIFLWLVKRYSMEQLFPGNNAIALDLLAVAFFTMTLLGLYLVPTELIVTLIVLATLHPRTVLHRLFSLWPLRWMGVRCFGIYILNMPAYFYVISTLEKFNFDVRLNWWHILVFFVPSVVFTLLAAGISYALLERPAQRWGARLLGISRRPQISA